MNIAKIITFLGIIAMTAVLGYAFTQADFFVDGGKLFSNPWGIVSLVDLYTGFTLFCAWIIYREKSLLVALLWSLGVMVLGFFAASLYAFLALQSSTGNWANFWMGKNA